jgi:arginine repressor
MADNSDIRNAGNAGNADNAMAKVYGHCARIMAQITKREEIDLAATIEALLLALADPTIETYNPLIKHVAKLDPHLLVTLFGLAEADISHQIELVEAERAADGSVVQVVVSRSIREFLAISLDETCHQTKTQCKSSDADGKCRNGAVQDADGLHDCNCVFHLEPLYAHLIMAALCALYQAQQMGMEGGDQYFAFLTALLHDIAKPITMTTFEFKDKKDGGVRIFPAMPFHGEYGARVLRTLYHPDMSIPIERWLGLCELVNRHMCGYHGANEGQSLIKRQILRSISFHSEILGFDLVPFLSTLSSADGTGKFPELQHVKSAEEFLADRAAFDQEMQKPFDLLEFMSSVGYNPYKMALMLIGRSGAGKSHYIRALIDFLVQKFGADAGAGSDFSSKIAWLSRDQAIAYCTVGVDQRLEGDAYVLSYRLYELNKELYSKANKKDKKRQHDVRLRTIQAQITWNAFAAENGFSQIPIIAPQGDEEEDSDYQTRVMTMVVPKLSDRIRDEYNARIEAALADPRIKLLVIDTMMTCFPRGVQHQMTQKLEKIFKIHIHVDSFVPIVGSNGYDEETQLKIGGPFGLPQLIHPDSKKSVKEFQHESADFTYKPASSNFRPAAVSSVVRTSSGSCNYPQTMEAIYQLVSRLPEPEIDEGGSATLPNPELEFAHLDLQEYVQMLVDSGKNLDEINDHFGLTGFKISNSLYQSPEALTRVTVAERLAYYGALARLTKLFAEVGIMDHEFGISELMDDDALAASISKSLMLIKYIDALYGERFWKNKWARQARGTVLFIHPITKKVHVLSYKLQRGAEVVTGQQKKAGIEETENIIGGNTGIFDDEQQATMDALIGEKAFETYATSKGDGSLCVWTLYTDFAKLVMDCVIEAFGSPLAKLIRDQSHAASDGKYLAVLSTQGTIFEGFQRLSHMAPYMVTACLAGTKLVEAGTLREFARTHTHFEAWNRWGSAFISSLMSGPLFCGDEWQNDAQTFLFEAICPNRTDPFTGDEHIELAISYDIPMLYFLGTSICSKFAYIPHMLYRQICIAQGVEFPTTFREPLWWHIRDGDGESTVSALLAGFSAVARHQMTQVEFLRAYPPSNVGLDLTDDALLASIPLDIEGLVLMTPLFFESDNIDLFVLLGIKKTGYSKAKTVEYYNTHKFKMKFVAYYLDLYQYEIARSRFPLVTRIADFFGPGNIREALTTICHSVMTLLDGTATYADADIEQSYKAKYVSLLPAKAARGFDNRPFDVQCKMMINIASSAFGADLIPLFASVFESIQVPDEADVVARSEMGLMLKGVVMSLKPWEFLHRETFVRNIAKFRREFDLDADCDDIDELVEEVMRQKLSVLDYESRTMQALAMLVLGFKLTL